MSYQPHVYYHQAQGHQAQGQGPMAGPGALPGYPPQAAYGMPGGVRPGYYAAVPQPYPPYYASPAPPAQERGTGGFFNFGNERFVTGLLAGAAVTYLLTNETVQRTAIKSAAQVWLAVQGGFEEVEERFRDAAAEIHAEE